MGMACGIVRADLVGCALGMIDTDLAWLWQLVKAYYTTSLLRGFFLYFASNEWFYDVSCST